MQKSNERTDEEIIIASKVKSVFSKGDGLDVLKFFMARAGYLDSNHYEGISAIDLAYREGRRALLAEIIQITNLDLKKVVDQATDEQGEWNAHDI